MMETITMKLNSPITDEQWNIITDAELEHSDEIEFTTPSGKKVMYAKVRHGKWEESDLDKDYVTCSECKLKGKKGRMAYRPNYAKDLHYCPNCGAKMDMEEE